MTKKVINRFDPFMPVKVNNTGAEIDSVDISSSNSSFEDFNSMSLNESLKFKMPEIIKGFTIVITKKTIGADNKIGADLLEDFIDEVSESFELPQYLILLNEGVLLLNKPSINNAISKLKKYGVKTLVSSESLNYFEYKVESKLFVNATSKEISDKMIFSKKLITL